MLAQQDEIRNSIRICKFHDPLVMLHGANMFERRSPIADKFYALTREVDSVRADQLKPDRSEQDIIDEAVFKPLFMNIPEQEKGLFWKYRHACS